MTFAARVASHAKPPIAPIIAAPIAKPCQPEAAGTASAGLKTAALAYRNLKRAGRWETVRPKYGFGWRTKHDPARFERHGDEVWLWPQQGNSRPYRAALEDDGDRDINGLDAMPDYVRVTEK